MIKSLIFDFDGVIHDTFDISFKIIQKVSPDLSREKYLDRFNGNIYQEENEEKIALRLKSAEKYFEVQEIEFQKLKINEYQKHYAPPRLSSCGLTAGARALDARGTTDALKLQELTFLTVVKD